MRILMLALGACLLLASVARPDTVVMKDGRTMHGDVVSEDGSKVVLRMKGIQVTLKRAEIDAIHKGEGESAGGAAGADDPVAARFSRAGNPSVDAARKTSLDSWRALEKAEAEAEKDASDPSGLRGQLASAQKKRDSMRKDFDRLKKKKADLRAKHDEASAKCSGMS